MTQTVTTTRTPHQAHNANSGTPQNQGYAPRNSGTPQDQGYSPRNSGTSQNQGYASRNSGTAQDQGYAPRNTPQEQGYASRNNTTPQHPEYASRNNTTPQHSQYAPQNSATSQNREYGPRNNAGGIRPVTEGNNQGMMSQNYRGDLSSGPRSNAYNSANLQNEDDEGLAGQDSIPRKQIGTSANTLYSSVQASSPTRAQPGHSRQQSAPKPLPSIPAAASRGYADRQTESASQPSSILNRSRPIPPSQAGPRDAQDIVDRAKTNTYDTQVVETVAPGQSYPRNVNH